ncbi:Pleckstrin-like proteiny domain [Sesbania bispinosa]|nr:Pleckstrin-like proteiny domain [Sesbania bispinosa]
MNPLCCIAPVSIDRDRTNPVVAKSPGQCQLGLDSTIRTVNSASKSSFSTQDSSSHGGADSVKASSAAVNHDEDDAVHEPRDSKVFAGGNGGGGVAGSVAGILYKWVNYGKGWRSRWFVLEDGVLSYYKIHGPDKILMSPARDRSVRVIGEESSKYMRKSELESESSYWRRRRSNQAMQALRFLQFVPASLMTSGFPYLPGQKTLHLRCVSREDRAMWIEALQSAKDLFPRALTSSDLATSEDIVVSTEKLRSRLSQEGISEEIINDCESIMLSEVSYLQGKLKYLQQKHVMLLDTLKTTGDNESQDGADAETDDDDGTYFDTNEILYSDALRSASYRSREGMGNASILDRDYILYDGLHGFEKEIKDISYPYVKRRDNLPEPKEKEKPVGLWSIIKDNIGKDLSGVCLPVYFNEPLSSLQKCFEDLEYSYLVDRALEWGKQGNDLMRILNIAAFAVSSYASTEGRQCKPFNPLLGETYEADYPDKGLKFFSEKVSHHPMIVACHCEGRGWKFWADSNLKGKFWGRSIQLDPVGVLTLQFEDGETFQWSKVTTSIYNIILGKIYCDHYGTMHIKGSGNYSCKLKFKEQSIIDRNPHQVHGFVQDNRTGEKVAMLIGKWDEAMYYVLGNPTTKPKGYDPMTEAALLWERDNYVSKTRYNLSPFAISLNEITPGLLEKLPPTDSRLRPDQRHLENGEYELANAEKLRLEQLQRQV